MRAIILAAGQGRRLLPWTHDLPKCLLPFAGRPLISWQMEALAHAGFRRATVVVGFRAHDVERVIARTRPQTLAVDVIFNPFHAVAENIASCWMAREEMVGEVAILNGDVLMETGLVERVAREASRPVTVTIDAKDAYDADDMKVQLDGDRVARIGKTLPQSAINAESIGLIWLKGLGAPLFAGAVESVMRQPGGVARWYLSAVDELAARGVVGTVRISGMGWTEVDYPADLARAELLAQEWKSLCVPAEESGASPYPLAQ